MTPADLYSRTPQYETHELSAIHNYCYSHIPEINTYVGVMDEIYDHDEKVQIKVLKEFDFDHRTFWRLATVWFEGNPVMIIRNAGREGDDHKSRFVTDPDQYKLMVKYINTLIPPDFNKIEGVVDATQEIDKLDDFYDNSLNGYFERHWY